MLRVGRFCLMSDPSYFCWDLCFLVVECSDFARSSRIRPCCWASLITKSPAISHCPHWSASPGAPAPLRVGLTTPASPLGWPFPGTLGVALPGDRRRPGGPGPGLAPLGCGPETACASSCSASGGLKATRRTASGAGTRPDHYPQETKGLWFEPPRSVLGGSGSDG